MQNKNAIGYDMIIDSIPCGGYFACPTLSECFGSKGIMVLPESRIPFGYWANKFQSDMFWQIIFGHAMGDATYDCACRRHRFSLIEYDFRVVQRKFMLCRTKNRLLGTHILFPVSDSVQA